MNTSWGEYSLTHTHFFSISFSNTSSFPALMPRVEIKGTKRHSPACVCVREFGDHTLASVIKQGRPRSKGRGRNIIECSYCHNSVNSPNAPCWFMTPPRCPVCDDRFSPSLYNENEGGLNDHLNEIRISYNKEFAINRKLNPVDIYWSVLTNCELAYNYAKYQ